MDVIGNMKFLDFWRFQSDFSRGIQLEDIIVEVELQVYRNSNSEFNFFVEKLKEEVEKLVKRVNGGSQGEIIFKTYVMIEGDDDDNDDDKDILLAELSLDDGCYDLEKFERYIKLVSRIKFVIGLILYVLLRL